MRTTHATYINMIPLPVQQWQADAAAGGAPEPVVVEPVAGEPQPKEEEDGGFGSTFAELANEKPEPVIEKPAVVVPVVPVAPNVVDGGLPAVGADGKPVETPAPAPAPGATTVQLTAEQAEAARVAAAAASPTAPKAGDPPPAPAPSNEIVEALRQIMGERPAPQQAAPAPAAPEITPYTAEEQTLVENYRKEFPEMAAAEELIRRQEHQAVVNYIFSQIGPVLAGLRTQTQTTAQMTHTQQLMAAVPDYAQIHAPVVEWIGKQPDFIKEAYSKVATNGSVPQVMQLIDRWRAETKTPVPQPAPAPAPAAAAPVPVVKPAVVKPPAGLLPVQSSRSGVPIGGINPDDFNAAFETFSQEGAAA